MADHSYEIIEEGYLLQRTGVNPETGQAWEPIWVCKHRCPVDVIDRWEVDKVDLYDKCKLIVF